MILGRFEKIEIFHLKSVIPLVILDSLIAPPPPTPNRPTDPENKFRIDFWPKKRTKTCVLAKNKKHWLFFIFWSWSHFSTQQQVTFWGKPQKYCSEISGSRKSNPSKFRLEIAENLLYKVFFLFYDYYNTFRENRFLAIFCLSWPRLILKKFPPLCFAWNIDPNFHLSRFSVNARPWSRSPSKPGRRDEGKNRDNWKKRNSQWF